MTDDIEALRAELERVEKERDELRVLRRKEQKRAEDLQASMDRARELAEDGAARHAEYPEPSGCLTRVALLLAGDDEPNEPKEPTTKGNT